MPDEARTIRDAATLMRDILAADAGYSQSTRTETLKHAAELDAIADRHASLELALAGWIGVARLNGAYVPDDITAWAKEANRGVWATTIESTRAAVRGTP